MTQGLQFAVESAVPLALETGLFSSLCTIQTPTNAVVGAGQWAGTFANLAGHVNIACTTIYLHPATSNDFPGSARGYRYTDELAALTDPHCIASLRSGAHCLGGYSDFLAAGADRF